MTAYDRALTQLFATAGRFVRTLAQDQAQRAPRPDAALRFLGLTPPPRRESAGDKPPGEG